VVRIETLWGREPSKVYQVARRSSTRIRSISSLRLSLRNRGRSSDGIGLFPIESKSIIFKNICTKDLESLSIFLLIFKNNNKYLFSLM